MAQDKLPSAQDIAAYLLRLAQTDGVSLTHKRLQKVLYYVQGWSLGKRDQPVFRDEIRAWREGPVVPEVFEQFKEQEGRVLPVPEQDPGLPRLACAFIASVWEDYKAYTERELIAKTHEETPWLNARAGYKDHEPSDKPIRESDLRDYFGQPSVAELTYEELRRIAAQPERAPAQSWYEEPTLCGHGG